MKKQVSIPVYAMIPLIGKGYSVSYSLTRSDNSVTTSSLSGYGKFPIDKYPDIPCIDLSSVPDINVKAILKLTDQTDQVFTVSDKGTKTLAEYIEIRKHLGATITINGIKQ